MSDFLYSVEREFDLPVEILWDAWVDATALEAWYHPTDLSVVPGSVTSEPEVGGAWAVAVDVPSEGFVAYFYGKYTEVVDQKLLAHTLCYTQSEQEFAARDESAPHHRIVIDFDSRGMYSWVKFSQYGELPDGEAVRAQA
ncbi:MAG: SRPBCC domain-containing protein, partial [Candidatus Nanopelagicales bacterium]|nr:SRPBCC domain-containing protein [Candidatus Nanopelagicales bacterium]